MGGEGSLNVEGHEMSMFEPVAAIAEVAERVIDKFWPDKMDDETRERLKIEAGKQAYELASADDSATRKFILDYEGKAKDVSPWLQNLRGSVRPMLTYIMAALFLAVLVAYAMQNLYFGGLTTSQNTAVASVIEALKVANMITLPFWFGEKVISRVSEAIGGAVKGVKEVKKVS